MVEFVAQWCSRKHILGAAWEPQVLYWVVKHRIGVTDQLMLKE